MADDDELSADAAVELVDDDDEVGLGIVSGNGSGSGGISNGARTMNSRSPAPAAASPAALDSPDTARSYDSSRRGSGSIARSALGTEEEQTAIEIISKALEQRHVDLQPVFLQFCQIGELEARKQMSKQNWRKFLSAAGMLTTAARQAQSMIAFAAGAKRDSSADGRLTYSGFCWAIATLVCAQTQVEDPAGLADTIILKHFVSAAAASLGKDALLALNDAQLQMLDDNAKLLQQIFLFYAELPSRLTMDHPRFMNFAKDFGFMPTLIPQSQLFDLYSKLTSGEGTLSCSTFAHAIAYMADIMFSKSGIAGEYETPESRLRAMLRLIKGNSKIGDIESHDRTTGASRLARTATAGNLGIQRKNSAANLELGSPVGAKSNNSPAPQLDDDASQGPFSPGTDLLSPGSEARHDSERAFIEALVQNAQHLMAPLAPVFAKYSISAGASGRPYVTFPSFVKLMKDSRSTDASLTPASINQQLMQLSGTRAGKSGTSGKAGAASRRLGPEDFLEAVCRMALAIRLGQAGGASFGSTVRMSDLPAVQSVVEALVFQRFAPLAKGEGDDVDVTSAVSDPGVQATLAASETTLQRIFAYYSTSGADGVAELRLNGVISMCREFEIIGKVSTQAAVELAFHQFGTAQNAEDGSSIVYLDFEAFKSFIAKLGFLCFGSLGKSGGSSASSASSQVGKLLSWLSSSPAMHVIERSVGSKPAARPAAKPARPAAGASANAGPAAARKPPALPRTSTATADMMQMHTATAVPRLQLPVASREGVPSRAVLLSSSPGVPAPPTLTPAIREMLDQLPKAVVIEGDATARTDGSQSARPTPPPPPLPPLPVGPPPPALPSSPGEAQPASGQMTALERLASAKLNRASPSNESERTPRARGPAEEQGADLRAVKLALETLNESLDGSIETLNSNYLVLREYSMQQYAMPDPMAVEQCRDSVAQQAYRLKRIISSLYQLVTFSDDDLPATVPLPLGARSSSDARMEALKLVATEYVHGMPLPQSPKPSSRAGAPTTPVAQHGADGDESPLRVTDLKSPTSGLSRTRSFKQPTSPAPAVSPARRATSPSRSPSQAEYKFVQRLEAGRVAAERRRWIESHRLVHTADWKPEHTRPKEFHLTPSK